MIKYFKKVLFAIFPFLRPKRAFCVGGRGCIEFSGGGRLAKIWHDRPTTEMMTDFDFELRNAAVNAPPEALKEIDSAEKQTNYVSKNILIPWALKLNLTWEGYKNEKNKEIDIDELIKYYGHHLRVVASLAYSANDSYKKKD